MRQHSEIERAFREMHPRLWRGLLAFTGSDDIASDAEAEAFTQAISRGAEIRDLDGWIWTSAFRIAGGMLATRSTAIPTAQFPNTFQFDEQIVELLELLGDLTEQQRKVIILRHVGNYRATEIATMLATSPGTVRVQLHRAHESLREQIGEAHERS